MDIEKFVRETKVKDLTALAQERGKQGHVAQANADGTSGLVHFSEASTKGRSGTGHKLLNNEITGESLAKEEALVASLFEGLPPIVRRSPEERFRSMLDRVIKDAMVSVRVHGYPVWPKSIQDKLVLLGWKERDPNVYAQCSSLVKQLFLEAGHIQAAKDQKKTTLDWHGKYNHVIEVKSPVSSGPVGSLQVLPATG